VCVSVAPDADGSAVGDSSLLSGVTAAAASPDRVRLYSPVSPDQDADADRDADLEALREVPLTPEGRGSPRSFASGSPYASSFTMGSYPDAASLGSEGADFGVRVILNQVGRRPSLARGPVLCCAVRIVVLTFPSFCVCV
jgi:hypothetical protein